jgi:hypothetical protein
MSAATSDVTGIDEEEMLRRKDISYQNTRYFSSSEKYLPDHYQFASCEQSSGFFLETKCKIGESSSVFSTIEAKDTIMFRISVVIDTVIEGNEVFKDVDKSKLMESLKPLIEKSPEELTSITDEELMQRIETVMVIETTSGMLKELSPEELKDFEEAVKRRKFFK